MSSHNEQKIGLFRLTSLVSGNLLGSGVFLLPATLAIYGSISLVGWILASFGAIMLALIFSQLSQLHPKTGGPYVYVREAFGNHIGFYLCWGYWVMSWVSNTTLLIGVAGYLGQIMGGLDGQQLLMIELAILFIITALNLAGLRAAANAEMVMTLLKVVPLILFPMLALQYVQLENFPVFNATDKPVFGVLNLVAYLTFWGFVGLETGTVPGGQVFNPKKNIPLATIIGTSIAASVYILGTFVIMGILPGELLINSKAPYADAAAYIWGGSWSLPVAIAAIMVCIGSLNGWTIVVARIPVAAAADGLFPQIFGLTNKKGTPIYSIVVSSILTVPLLIMSMSDELIDQFNLIMEMSTTLILIIYLVCIFAFITLTKKAKIFKGRNLFVGIAGLIFAAWAISASSIKMVILSLALIAIGIPVHVWLELHKRKSIIKTS